ncbi:MAG: HD-GYP domain-containing protein [Acidobacteriota bacterium]
MTQLLNQEIDYQTSCPVKFDHQDLLRSLNDCLSLNEKLKIIHQALQSRCNFVDRISVASYDERAMLVKTFVASGDTQPLVHYSAPLSSTSSLREIIKIGKPRVINNLSLLDKGTQEHTHRIRAQGYLSSYTLPLCVNATLGGFIFFNSYQQDCFSEAVLPELDVYGHLISSIVGNEIAAIKTLQAALQTANQMVHLRDPETGRHLDRMTRFSRLIAQELALQGRYKFNDEFIERIFFFAPMHDIGKIGIPDYILMKPDKLNPQEFEIMKTHTVKGRDMIDAMLINFGLQAISGIDMLRNIAVYHHETLDGKGYPYGLKENEIPIEARIVAVADIFDALTSRRCYKSAWSNREAFAALRQLTPNKLDSDCVAVLIDNPEKVVQIQLQFVDE